MRRLLNVLRGDSPPYIVTLLFAAVAWYLTYVVDTARHLPLLEQRITPAPTAPAAARPGEHYATLYLENLSDEMFKNTVLDVVFGRGPGSVTRLGPTSGYPPSPGPMISPTLENGSISITLAELQPGDRLSIGFFYVHEGTPVVVLRGTDTSSKHGVMMVPPSLTTFYIRHQTCLLTILLTLFALFTIASLLRGRREDFDT